MAKLFFKIWPLASNETCPMAYLQNLPKSVKFFLQIVNQPSKIAKTEDFVKMAVVQLADRRPAIKPSHRQFFHFTFAYGRPLISMNCEETHFREFVSLIPEPHIT